MIEGFQDMVKILCYVAYNNVWDWVFMEISTIRCEAPYGNKVIYLSGSVDRASSPTEITSSEEC
jgi:hypothetical protein